MPPTKIRKAVASGRVPTSLLTGELAINEFDRELFYLDPTAGAPASLLDQVATLAPPNNLIINGAMEVDQVKNGALQSAVANFAYVLDMVKFGTSGAQVLSAQQVTDAPPGFSKSLKFAVTTANATPGSGDFCYFHFPLEGRSTARLGFGAATATSISLGFYAKAFRAGVYSICITNAALNRSYSTPFTIASSAMWQWISVTIPTDITGTWATDNSLGIDIGIVLMAGTSKQVTANTWTGSAVNGVTGMVNGVTTTGDFFQITGACAFPGYVIPSATRATAVQRSFTEQLELCSRYFQKSYEYEVVPGTSTYISCSSLYISMPSAATYLGGIIVRFPVPMRAIPTLAFYNPGNGNLGFMEDTGNGSQIVASGAINVGQKGFNIIGTLSANNSLVHLRVQWTADARL